MLVQIKDDVVINTDKINYVKCFKDLLDGKEKTYIRFIDKDSVCVDISFEEFLTVMNKANKFL